MKTNILLTAALGIISFSNSCYAVDQKAVLNSIKSYDNAFIANRFAAQEFEADKLIGKYEMLSYEGKYHAQHWVLDKNSKKMVLMDMLFDGRHEFTTIKNTISITNGASKMDSPTDRMISMLPGACFFKGRGLSMLTNAKVSPIKGSSLVLLQGQTPDINGERIRATLDPKQKFLARRIERLDKNGKPFVVIETQGAQNGGLMPLSSTVKIVFLPKLPVKRYVFSNSRFGFKPQNKFEFVVDKPMLIADSRTGSPLVLNKVTTKRMKKADVFALTDKQNAKDMQLKQQEAALENNQKWGNYALTFIPLVAAALLLGWRSKKRVQS